MTSRLLVDKIEGKSTSSHVIMPQGHVIQMQHFIDIDSSHIASASTSFVATGVKVNITPKAVGNTILVQFVTTMAHKGGGTIGMGTLYIDGSQASGTGQYWGGYLNSSTHSNDHPTRVSNYIYTTVDTNNHLFEIYIKSSDSNTYYVKHGNSCISLIATEIQG